MVTLNPIRRALVPVDSRAAQQLCSPNYDEFQSDQEIYDLLQRQPESVLKITMPHCHVSSPESMLEDGCREALEIATREMQALRDSPLTSEVEDVLCVYELVDPSRPGIRQIGLGGMARIDEIRTDATPRGTIIRNEGVRTAKARGRADLIRVTQAIIGMVNHVVDDDSGNFARALESYADSHETDFHVEHDGGVTHKIWLINDPQGCGQLAGLLAAEPCAYVADGNHRSAAAAMLGSGEFLGVFFPAATMGLAPYNRLAQGPAFENSELQQRLAGAFSVKQLAAEVYQPETVHEIGLYTNGAWFRLVPRAHTYDPAHAVESLDADIVQRHIFQPLLGIDDAADERLTFVGGNRDAEYLKQRVDLGHALYAITLTPVTMEQFVEVCRQNRLMPPKSSWFEPKIRSGLVMALLES